MADLYGGGAEDLNEEARLLDQLAADRARLRRDEERYVAQGDSADQRRTTTRRSRAEARRAATRAENVELQRQAQILRQLEAAEARIFRQQRALGSGRSPLTLGPGGSQRLLGPGDPAGALVPYGGGAGDGGGRRPPPPPPPPPTGDGAYGRGRRRGSVDSTATEMSDEDFRRYEQAARNAGRANEYMRDSERRMADATRQAGVERVKADRSLRAHGALTTEFISAAARGQVTMREFGYQIGATVGKFAGWTAAAGLVYGALGAVTQLGKGAIDTSAGVNQMSRVINNIDTDQAQQNILALAREFQVTPEIAADAIYGMGKVFHDLPAATKAARAALYSFKAGEVDVGTSTKNLVAIVQGFGLPADQMALTFDRINQAQNAFGVSIADTEAGLARAAGTWRNAGGDLDYLTVLFTAVQKSTGESGTTIGTGMARSARFIRENTAELERLGVQVKKGDIQATFESAFKVGREHQDRIPSIAKGLFDPQYARLIESTLRDQSILERAKVELLGEAPKGSAQRELDKIKASARSILADIGPALQRLGGELARAGAFDALILFFKAFRDGVNLAGDMLHIFNQLPGPLRHTLTLALQIGAALAVLRHFGGFRGVAGRVPSLEFLDRPERRAHNIVSQGLGSQTRYAQERHERLSVEAFNRRLDAEASKNAVKEQYGKHRADFTDIRNLDERAKVQEEYAQAVERSRRLDEQATEAHKQALGARKVVVRTQQEEKDWRKVAHRDVYDQAAARGYDPAIFPAGFDRPTTEDGLPRPAQRDISPRMERFRQSLNRSLDNVYAMGRTASAGYGRIDDSARRGVNRMAQAGTSLGRAGARLGGLPGQFRREFGELSRSLGVLDKAFLGISVAIIGGELLKSYFDGIGNSIDAASELGRQAQVSSNDLQRRADEIRRNAAKPHGFIQTALGTDISGALGLRGAETAEELSAKELENIARLQRRDRAGGGPVANQLRGEVAAQVNRDIERYKRNEITWAELQALQEKRVIEARTARDGKGEKDEYAIAQKYREQAPRGDRGRFRDMNLEDLTIATSNILAQAAGGFADATTFKELGQAYEEAFRQLQGSTDQKDIQKLLQSRDAYLNGIEQTVQSELENSLSRARTPGDRRTAYREADRNYQNALRDPRRQLRLREQRADDQRTVVEGMQRDPQAGDKLQSELRRLDQLEKDAKRYREDYKRLRHNINQRREALRKIVVQDELEREGAQGQLRVARAGSDPVARARAEVTNAEIQLRTLMANEKYVDPNEIIQARAALINARQQLADSIDERRKQLIDAQFQLRLAGVTDPVQRARLELQNAIALAPTAKSDIEKIQNAAAIKEGRAALAEAVRQQAEDLRDAIGEFRLAKIEDPVARAREELRQARQKLGSARTKADRYRARAGVVTAERNLRDQRVQEAIDQQNFLFEMGKISQAAYIEALEKILSTQKMGKEARRNLQLQIHNLKKELEQESGFDFNIGNIKLPTVYEIRRAIGEANNGRVNVQQRNNINVNVTKGADVDEVFTRIDQYARTGLKIAVRQAA